MSKVKIILVSISIALVAIFATNVFAQMDLMTTTTTVAVAKMENSSTESVKGEIISFTGLVAGGTGKVDKSKAEELAGKGHPIVLKSGNKVYFLMNQDGTLADKRVAGYAAANQVVVKGKVSKKMGLNVIIIEMIDAIG